MPSLIPLDDAAKKVGIDRTTIYRWIRQGRLKRYKGGIGDSRTYVDLAELRELQKPRPEVA